MYEDEIFDSALKEVQEEKYKALQGEVKTVESIIERLLTQLLECSASVSERDFNVCGI